MTGGGRPAFIIHPAAGARVLRHPSRLGYSGLWQRHDDARLRLVTVIITVPVTLRLENRQLKYYLR